MTIFGCNIMIDTFFKKGVKDTKNDWGVALISGPQGSGKNYLATLLLTSQYKNIKVKTNIHSLKLNREIEYFTKIDEIIDDIEEHVIYVIDEISKKYEKTSKTDKPFYAWLQQSRKVYQSLMFFHISLKFHQ